MQVLLSRDRLEVVPAHEMRSETKGLAGQDPVARFGRLLARRSDLGNVL